MSLPQSATGAKKVATFLVVNKHLQNENIRQVLFHIKYFAAALAI